LGHVPDRIGRFRVALWSLVIEAIGQAMLWRAPRELVALSGALVTGLGCALMFPALGVEVLKRVMPANRGCAMGGFVAFVDIAYGLAGPGAGLVAGQVGYAAVYLLGTARALLASGDVLVVGGYNPAFSALYGVGTAELYDPVAQTFSSAGAMNSTRQGFTLTVLGSGRVLLVGGLPNFTGLPEFYQ
jgi:MFS family permease